MHEQHQVYPKSAQYPIRKDLPPYVPKLSKNFSLMSNISVAPSLQQQRQLTSTSKKAQVFISSFLAYTSVHALRTTYSFSKSFLPQQINVQQQMIGIVDSVMLLFIGLGNFIIAIRPLQKPIRAVWIALLLCSLQYCLIPISMSNLTGNTAFTMLVLLMGLSGYLQSFAWPNLLPLVHTVCSPDKDTTLLGFWATCPNFGNLIGFIVCQLIVLNNGYSWQVGMYIVACYMAVNALYMCFRIQQMPNQNLDNETDKEFKNTNIPQISIEQPSQKQPLLTAIHSQDNINQMQSPSMNLRRLQSAPPQLYLYSIPSLQKQPSVIQVFKHSPRVTLLTIAFSLIKSVMYGILLWLPAYFYNIGLVDYSLYIPMTFDVSAIVGSTLLGLVFKHLAPNKKNSVLLPVLVFLLIFFIMLKIINFNVTGYFIIISFVGLCLGGSYNTMAGLVTMQLVRALPAELQTKYLRFYSALLMAIANVVTGITQVIISYTVGQDQGALFGIFVVYTGIILCAMVGVVIIQLKSMNDKGLFDIRNQNNNGAQKYQNFKDEKEQKYISEGKNISKQIQFERIK